MKGAFPKSVLYGFDDSRSLIGAALLASEGRRQSRKRAFAEAGLPATVFSHGAKDIGLAFGARPTEALATGCIETLKPTFILPND